MKKINRPDFTRNNRSDTNQSNKPVQKKSGPTYGGLAKDSLIQRSINEQAKDKSLQNQNTSISTSKMPAAVQAKMENSFSTDLSDVNIHANSDNASNIGALAYTQGKDIHFAPGQYNPESKSGQELLGHELTHVVQQRQGNVQPTLQAKGIAINDDSSLENEADTMGAKAAEGCNTETVEGNVSKKYQSSDTSGGNTIQRRTPANKQGTKDGLGEILTDYTKDKPADKTAKKAVDAENFSAHEEGLELLLQREFARLQPNVVEFIKVLALNGNTKEEFDKLPKREQLIYLNEAFLKCSPSRELKDPRLIDTGPRKGTQDAANIKSLVKSANSIFAKVHSGSQDTSLEEVFGKSFVGLAKVKFAKAKKRMNELHALNKIVTDRSGYNEEVELGGLTSPMQLALSPDTIDNPSNAGSIATMVHESLHAGNEDVSDYGYLGTPAFKQLSENVKLTNAAHFEVIAHRILEGSNPMWDGVFTPAGSLGPGGSAAPTLTPMEKASREASEIFRQAWTIGLNLHSQFVYIYKSPSEYNHLAITGARYKDSFPFWSKVMKMTIHNKTKINPYSSNVSIQPVSLLDIALSEGFVRRLARGMDKVPSSDVLTKLSDSLDPTSKSQVFNDDDFAKKWAVKEVLKNITNMTGNPDHDFKAVMLMGEMPNDYNVILKKRDVSEFSI